MFDNYYILYIGDSGGNSRLGGGGESQRAPSLYETLLTHTCMYMLDAVGWDWMLASLITAAQPNNISYGGRIDFFVLDLTSRRSE